MWKTLIAFTRAVDAMNDRFGVLATWAVLVSCLVSAANAGSRYALDISSNGWLELQWYLFAVIVMFGAATTFRTNGHVRVDILYSRLTPRGKAWLDLAGILVFLLPSMLVLGYYAWPFFLDAWRTGEVSSNPGGLVRWPVKFALPAGFVLLGFQGVSEAVKRIAFLRGERSVEADGAYERPLQ